MSSSSPISYQFANDFSIGNDYNTDFLARYQVMLPSAIASMASGTETASLSEDFVPSDYDIVCGRGKGSYNQPGNKRFRDLVKTYIPQYVQAKTKFDKSFILSNIIDHARSLNDGTTRFVKKTNGQWCELSEEQAREKVGHTIREAIVALSQPPKISKALKPARLDAPAAAPSTVPSAPYPPTLKSRSVFFSDQKDEFDHLLRFARGASDEANAGASQTTSKNQRGAQAA